MDVYGCLWVILVLKLVLGTNISTWMPGMPGMIHLRLPWLQIHPTLGQDTLHYLRIEEGSAVSLRMNGQMLGTTTMDGLPHMLHGAGRWIPTFALEIIPSFVGEYTIHRAYGHATPPHGLLRCWLSTVEHQEKTGQLGGRKNLLFEFQTFRTGQYLAISWDDHLHPQLPAIFVWNQGAICWVQDCRAWRGEFANIP